MKHDNESKQVNIIDKLPDLAAEADSRAVPIDRVGVRGLRYPIQVLDRDKERQHTTATIGLYVDLPQEFKGTHMSRFIEILNSVRGELTIRTMPEILAEIQRRLHAKDAFLDVDFPFFMNKRAPVSGAESLMEYRCRFKGARRGEVNDFVLGVDVPVTSLCPCSKAISERGAHNQRSNIGVEIRSREFIWIEELIETVESMASAPLYALLKRDDEKYVTEQAYDNPKFVEDIVRDVSIAVRAFDGVYWTRVVAENYESIHNHSAYAEVEWPRDEDLVERQIGLDSNINAVQKRSGAFQFGQWLKTVRESRKLSQQALAERIEVTASYLCRVESGEKTLSIDAVGRVADALSLDPVKTRLRAGYIPSDLLSKIAADPERFLLASSNF